mmetsp:Transcript_38028/g.41223  ORF Transcript_38028/g.41223 Transcript_38028/m.41223 type:complete len:179 (+) Transcript_38028:390-926(+)
MGTEQATRINWDVITNRVKIFFDFWHDDQFYCRGREMPRHFTFFVTPPQIVTNRHHHHHHHRRKGKETRRRRRTAEDQQPSHIGIVIVTNENFHPPLPPAQPWEMLLLRKRESIVNPPSPQSKVVGIGVEELVLKRCSMVVTSLPPPGRSYCYHDSAMISSTIISIATTTATPRFVWR